MSLLDKIAERQPDGVRASVALVAAVNVFGTGRTVDLQVDGAYVADVPVSAAYPAPTEGDVVLVLKVGAAWHVAYSLGRPTSFGSQNLLTNPGFELDAVGVGVPNGWRTLVRNVGGAAGVVADAHSGGLAWQVAIENGRARYLLPFEALPVTPGVQLRIGVWAKASATFVTGESCTLEAWPGPTPQDAAYENRVTIATISTPPGVWRLYDLPYTPAPGVTWLRIALVTSGEQMTVPSRGTTVTFDDAFVRSA